MTMNNGKRKHQLSQNLQRAGVNTEYSSNLAMQRGWRLRVASEEILSKQMEIRAIWVDDIQGMAQGRYSRV